jgi:catalase
MCLTRAWKKMLTNTVRSSFRKIKSGPADVAHSEWVGRVQAYSSDVEEEDWEQPRDLWKIFKDSGDDEVFLNNLSSHVNKALPEVQEETVRKLQAPWHKDLVELG